MTHWIIYIRGEIHVYASRRLLSSAAVAGIFAAAVCSAQNIAPAHSGTVHYFEGDVTVDGVKLVSQVAPIYGNEGAE